MNDGQDLGTAAGQAVLPVLPVVITTLMSTDFRNPDAFGDLLHLISIEPCLAIRLLQIDDAQGCIRRGETLPKALMHIGSTGLEQLITRQSSAKVFTPMTDPEKGLWMHSLQVALLAQALAGEFRKLKVDPDQAYLAGLLHDIGRFSRYEQIARAPNEVDKANWDTPEALLKAEAAIFGTDHVLEGKKICQRLPLPKYIEDSVFHHHSPITAIRGPTDDSRRIIEMVQLADMISVWALRHGGGISDLGDRCRHFINRHSEFVKHLKPKTFTLQSLSEACLARADKEFLDLKLGPPPGAAY